MTPCPLVDALFRPLLRVAMAPPHDPTPRSVTQQHGTVFSGDSVRYLFGLLDEREDCGVRVCILFIANCLTGNL